MKYIVILAAILSIGQLMVGLYFYVNDNELYHKFFGFGTASLFLITFPLFLFWRRNKTDMSKYIWRNKNEETDNNKKTEV